MQPSEEGLGKALGIGIVDVIDRTVAFNFTFSA
jgi:hypothetical protein